VLAALGRAPTAATIRDLRVSVAEEPGADWERDLLDALVEPRPDARIALVNEQLGELDRRLDAWSRVPRVCASLATSVGILLGTLVLREGLANAPDLSGDLGQLFVRDIIGDAFTVASFGIAGTTFSIAANAQARRLTRARLEATDRMIERLEAIPVGGATSP
jgi:hypothetical protein